MPAPEIDRRHPRRRLAFVLLIGVAVFLLAGLAGWGWATGYLPVQLFNAASWKNPETPYTRVRMVSALLLTHDLSRMSKSEVVGLLGPPTKTSYFSDWDFVYYLGPERSFFGIDSEWLAMRFGPDDRVSEWDLVRD